MIRTLYKAVFVVALWLQFPAIAGAENYKLPEYEAKALFLFNFTRFVQWPPDAFSSPEATINICIAGDDPFDSSLDFVKTRLVNNRGVKIKLLEWPADTRNCHVLFVSSSEETRMLKILSTVLRQPLLTVSDINRFALKGGVIEMYVHDNRVRFRINTSAAMKHRLNIGSHLLELSEIITGEAQ
jgi:hypothetical protein